MRAFICEVDPSGLHRLIPEDVIPEEDLRRLAESGQGPSQPRLPTSFLWTLLADEDVDDLMADIGAGRHVEACGLLLNRAVELITLRAATTGPARGLC